MSLQAKWLDDAQLPSSIHLRIQQELDLLPSTLDDADATLISFEYPPRQFWSRTRGAPYSSISKNAATDCRASI
ncbi:hypothetical protein DK37_11425 [Halomonas sp. SUBG004]|nr:hypothetical protein DK37_11425 [Halomonas sp. SUBG004]